MNNLKRQLIVINVIKSVVQGVGAKLFERVIIDGELMMWVGGRSTESYCGTLYREPTGSSRSMWALSGFV